MRRASIERRRSIVVVFGLLTALLVGGYAGTPPSAAGGSCRHKRTCSAPSAPTNLAVQSVSTTSVSLAWSPAVPATGSTITGYRVSTGGGVVGTTTATAYDVTALACGTTYTFAVAAIDDVGRVSVDAVTNASTAACTASGPVGAGVWVPPPGTTWQWQITGQIDQSVPAQMFDIDLFDAQPGEINAGVIGQLHARGAAVICYMDSGAWESYRPDASEFPASVIGNSTGWNGEYWLDIRPQSWPLFEWIVVDRMRLAAKSGCDGIEPDQNNPVGNDPGFPITYADEKAWYLEVAKDAHALGLSVGMKNGIEIVDHDLVNAFDWALNEQCFQYKECDALTRFVDAGKAVFQVEYRGDPSTFCPTANALGFSSMKKRLSLGAWRIPCW
ncbi:MAG TPA: endo alpha-1,4 polygalactosaminidase [Gaiellaceae bacterium]|nr:endo alpha-1,4 polygalactosaminidase [Gaiellaceae bacterium]